MRREGKLGARFWFRAGAVFVKPILRVSELFHSIVAKLKRFARAPKTNKWEGGSGENHRSQNDKQPESRDRRCHGTRSKAHSHSGQESKTSPQSDQGFRNNYSESKGSMSDGTGEHGFCKGCPNVSRPEGRTEKANRRTRIGSTKIM